VYASIGSLQHAAVVWLPYFPRSF